MKAFPRVAFALTGTSLIAAPAAVLPSEAVTLDMGSTAEIAVKNGNGCLLTTHPAHVADLIDPATRSPGPSLLVGEDDLVVKVRGKNFGSAVLLARRQGSSNEQLVITVIDRRPQKFTPTKAHHHAPVSEPDGWLKICAEAAKDPDEHFFLKILARNDADPETVVKQAKSNPFSDLTGKSMAMEHFNFYLSGRGDVQRGRQPEDLDQQGLARPRGDCQEGQGEETTRRNRCPRPVRVRAIDVR